MALWIFLCLFASIGIVQCGMWLWETFRLPRGYVRVYHVIPLYDNPDCVEAELRLTLSELMSDRLDPVVLADTGIGEECRVICENLLNEFSCAYICELEDIPDFIKTREDLQLASNNVE